MPNPDTDMSTLEWTAIRLGGGSKSVTITANVVEGVELFLSMVDTNLLNIRSQGNIYSDTVVTKVRYDYFNATANRAINTFIEEMMYATHTTLPNPQLNSYVKSFDNHIIRYNGKLLINDNGTWRDMMGTTVTA